MPLGSEGQTAGRKLPQVTLICTTCPMAELLGPEPINSQMRAFVHELRDRGWIDGQTVVIERRSAERKFDRAPAIFADLARQNVDAIVLV
jgi:putative tryptophan/tyrosine transport system substrate-binding protein